jgi:thiol-disulfide isomerase/thioredoxin
MTIRRTLIALTIFLGAITLNAQPSDLKTNITDLNQEDKVNTNFNDIIKQYEGKVVYLDFWASWCRPCKGEMPHSLKMQEKFKNKDVAFVYISTDRDETAWKNAISSLKITGEHFRVNKNVYTQMNDKFNVQYIPRYVLIDKTGKVVDANAKRPSDAAVAGDIEKLL